MTTDHRFYQQQDRDTPRMFAPSLRQAVEDDPAVLGLDAAVDQLDLSALEAQYAPVGHPAYPPAVMLKVLLYGYSLGLRASRQLERACKRDDAFRFLAGGLRPDHNSLCRFRRRHGAQLPELFAQTVHLCQEAGLVSLGEVALDGTKLRANRARATLAATQQLTQALQEAEAADQTDAAGAAEEAEDAAEECTFMKLPEGILPAYNAQAAVDGAHQVIVACAVDASPNDSAHLVPMVAQVVEVCGQAPQAVLADGSYGTVEAITQLEAQGVPVYVPTREPGQAHLTWVAQEGAYRCLAGHWLRPVRTWRDKVVYEWLGCGRCPQKQACGVQGKMKRVYVWAEDSPVGRARARLASAAGKRRYRRRQAIVEPVFGGVKHNRGIRRLLLRGKSGAGIEWRLVCMAHNLRKWARAVQPTAAGAPPTRWRGAGRLRWPLAASQYVFRSYFRPYVRRAIAIS